MCERCDEIDVETAHYRRLKRDVMDKKVLESLTTLIADLEAQKATLHPELEE